MIVKMKPTQWKVYKENEDVVVERNGNIIQIYDNQMQPMLMYWLKETVGLSERTIDEFNKNGKIEWIDL